MSHIVACNNTKQSGGLSPLVPSCLFKRTQEGIGESENHHVVVGLSEPPLPLPLLPPPLPFSAHELFLAMAPVRLVMDALRREQQQRETIRQQQQQQQQQFQRLRHSTYDEEHGPIDSEGTAYRGGSTGTSVTATANRFPDLTCQDDLAHMLWPYWKQPKCHHHCHGHHCHCHLVGDDGCVALGPSHRYRKTLLQRFIALVDNDANVDCGNVSESLLELLLFLHHHHHRNNDPPIPDPNESCYLTFGRIEAVTTVRTTTVTTTAMTTMTTACITESSLSTQPPLRIRIFPHHNDVGLRVWEAAVVLSEYLWCHRATWFGPGCGPAGGGGCRRIVELGAGTGLTSLVVVAAAFATTASTEFHVTCTDYAPTTLDNLKHNLLLNQAWLRYHYDQRPQSSSMVPDLEPEANDPTMEQTNGGSSLNAPSNEQSTKNYEWITAEYLEWSDYGNGVNDLCHDCSSNRPSIPTTRQQKSLSSTSSVSVEQRLAQADLLLAADVIYDRTCIPALAKTVRRFFQSSSRSTTTVPPSWTTNQSKCAIFATTLRNRDTFAQFQHAFEQEGISTIRVLWNANHVGDWRLPVLFPIQFVQSRDDVQIVQLGMKVK